MNDPAPVLLRRRVSVGIGVLVAAIGVLVCIGWWIESVTLVQIRADLAPMKFNTALSFALLGTSLALWGIQRPMLSTIAASLVVALCGLTMVQHITGLNLRIDTLLHEPFTLTETRHPGRMSHYAGWSFVGLGLVLLLRRYCEHHGTALVTCVTICVCVMVLTCAALVGYATGHHLPLSGGTNMAFHTSIAFITLSWGVLLQVWPVVNGHRAGLVNALLTVPIAATTLGITTALWLLPLYSEHDLNDGAARPVRPVIAVLVLAACITTAAIVAARVGFGRAAVMRRTNSRLKDEIAQREQVESAQRLLVSELDHRVRNTLSQVLALADSTARATNSVDEFHGQFRDRIRALSRAHSVLADTRKYQVPIGPFLRAVLEPFTSGDSPRITLEGADILAPARATTALCMVFYELAANAAKHGALRSPDGHIEITWRRIVNGETCIEILWKETGGTPLTREPEPGFGVSLIRTMVPHELGGKTELTFGPQGVTCRVRFSLTNNETYSPTGVYIGSSSGRIAV